MSKEVEEIEQDLNQFDELEQGFHDVIADLVSDRSLDSFRENYESLHTALVNSHQKNTQLINKCKQLNNEILANANKVTSVLSLSQDDQRTIAGLRSEFEKAWKMVEISQEREEKSKEVIDTLKEEVQTMSRIVEKGGNSILSDQYALDEITESISGVKKEIQIQTNQLQALNNTLNETKESSNKHLQDVENLKNEEISLQKEKESEITKFMDIKNEIKELLDQIDEIKNSYNDQKKSLENATKKVSDQSKLNQNIQQSVIESRQNTKSENDDLEANHQHIALLEGRLKRIQNDSKKVQELISTRNQSIAIKESTLSSFKQDLKEAEQLSLRSQNEYEEAKKEYNDVNEAKVQLRLKIPEKHKAQLLLLSKVNAASTTTHVDIAKIQRSTKEMKKTQLSLDKEIHKTDNEEKMGETYLNELISVKGGIHDDQTKVNQIDSEILQYQNQRVNYHNNMIRTFEEIKSQNVENDGNLLKISEIGNSIHHQDSLNDNIRNERDFASQAFLKAKQENANLLGENSIIEQQIRVLKNEIRTKDKECVETHYLQKIIKAEIIEEEAKAREMRAKLENATTKIAELKNQITRSQYLLNQGHYEVMKQNQVINELSVSREIVDKGTAKKNNERDLLREKIKDLSCIISQSAISYDRLMKKIAQLKETLENEVIKYQRLANKTSHYKALKIEWVRVSKSLLETQGRARGLEEEISKPLNVHRWRFIESTNPEMAQLLKFEIQLRDQLMMKINTKERLTHIQENLQDQCDKQTGHLEKGYSGSFYEEYQYFLDILKKKTKQLQTMQNREHEQRNEVTNRKETILTVREMVREEKSITEKIRKKNLANAPPVQERKIVCPNSSRKEKTKVYIGGGFAVGDLSFGISPRIEKGGASSRLGTPSPNLVLPNKAKQRPKTSLTKGTRRTPLLEFEDY